jgi:N6-L-threonylcarbamoyladenine synthase
MILAVETSCDDTCVAAISAEGEILANVISSQGIHDLYGGVVPEIASRHHLQLLDPTLQGALRLAGASLDDVELVAARGLPFAPVDHLHGHIAASYLAPDPFEPPFLALLASGGHTLLADVRDPGPGWRILGQTLDDAAGEAFDKGARLLGLGYPGGPALQKLAAGGDPQAFDFPTGHRMPGLDFSFAGLKTALLYKIRDLGQAEAERQAADLAASYQRAIVEALTIRVKRAIKQTGHTRLAVGGGVAANGPLREAMTGLGLELDIPPMKLCTDNAAMIASAARYSEQMPFPQYLAEDVYATGEPGRRAA